MQNVLLFQNHRNLSRNSLKSSAHSEREILLWENGTFFPIRAHDEALFHSHQRRSHLVDPFMRTARTKTVNNHAHRRADKVSELFVNAARVERCSRFVRQLDILVHSLIARWRWRGGGQCLV